MPKPIAPPAALPVLALLLAFLLPAAEAAAAGAGEEPEERPSIASKVAGLEARQGFLDLHVDDAGGKVWLRLPPRVSGPDGVEMIYAEGIRGGLGSNPVGLDRSRQGDSRLVRFRRMGRLVMLEQLNTGYRAVTESEAERRAVRDSFASSVLWAGEIAAADPDGSVLVDLTPFLTGDVFGFAEYLDGAGQGSFQLDGGRCAVDPDQVLVFPDNVEIDALLTFTSAKPGGHVRQTAPDPHAVSLVEHHTFLRLPDPGYRPRRFDPRAGSWDLTFLDYSAPLDRPLERKLIVRHRLEKSDPSAARSRVKEPIVYYVDRGIPEPVRGALVEGASWWAQAFEAAGFIDAYRVELLPEGVHPLDARYNVVNWVHRSTRGWSYGGGLVDPRTGEMIKGNVLLGSLRVRQDRLLFEGLAGTAATGTGRPDDPVELALARIRQLAAHEVGHTLGFTHNFAASTYGRASVMDYPAPLVEIDSEGRLDFSKAYATGAGAWDLFAVKYAYGEPSRQDKEEVFLEEVIREGMGQGLVFITDHDARPAGAAQPAGSLWDNGPDPVAELDKVLRIRRIALDAFAADRVAEGRPLALLQEVFMPVYFHHRYQMEAAAKVIGGMDYAYAVRGDGRPPARMLDTDRQVRALEAILGALDPEALDIPEAALALLMPRPFGHPGNREIMEMRTAPAFDALGAARTAAGMAVAMLLQPQRAARLVDFHRRDAAQPGLRWLLETLVAKAFHDAPPRDERRAALARVVRESVVDGLIALSSDAAVTGEVRAETDQVLRELVVDLDSGDRAHESMLALRIVRFLDRRIGEVPADPEAADPPPGSPIGSGGGPAGLPRLAGCSWEAPWII